MFTFKSMEEVATNFKNLFGDTVESRKALNIIEDIDTRLSPNEKTCEDVLTAVKSTADVISDITTYRYTDMNSQDPFINHLVLMLKEYMLKMGMKLKSEDNVPELISKNFDELLTINKLKTVEYFKAKEEHEKQEAELLEKQEQARLEQEQATAEIGWEETETELESIDSIEETKS